MPPAEPQRSEPGEASAAVRGRVEKAHQLALGRQGKANADLATSEIDLHCLPDENGAMLLGQAISRLMLSARGYHRILKIARTIADLAGEARVGTVHVAEAIQYRRLDRAA